MVGVVNVAPCIFLWRTVTSCPVLRLVGCWMNKKLLRIEAPHFVAGAVFNMDKRICIKAAPIVRWMLGHSPASAMAYLERKKWPFSWI